MGSPQGAPISPLLANIYMRRFVLGWKTGGHEKRLKRAHRQLRGRLRHLLPRHGRRGHGRDAGDDVQAEADGERDRRRGCAACRRRRSTFWVTPSVGTTTAERASPIWDHARRRRRSTGYAGAITELTRATESWLDVEELIGRINRKLRGWSNYFRLGTVSKAYRTIDSHTRHRLRQWLCAKYKVRGRGRQRFPDAVPARGSWGCTSFSDRSGNCSWANVWNAFKALSESRMRENRPSGSMSGVWKRSTVGLVRHRQTKGPATDRPNLNHRATPRLYSGLQQVSGCGKIASWPDHCGLSFPARSTT